MSNWLIRGHRFAPVIVIDRTKRRRITHDQVVRVACLLFLATMIVWRWFHVAH